MPLKTLQLDEVCEKLLDLASKVRALRTKLHSYLKGFQVIVFLLLHLQGRYAFLLEGQCSAGPPCQCAGDTLYCSYRGFTSVPPFHPMQLNLRYLRIHLEGNNLWTIRANAFRNLAPTTGIFIQVDISDNELSHIDDDAFSGVENEIGVLDLEDNSLRVLPKAIAKLANLRGLYLRDNLLTSLDPFVINGISSSLQKFRLSLEYFNSWPKEIKLLTALEVLHVEIGDIQMDDNAFDGSVNTLQQLHISDSFYDYISPAVCKLRVLSNIIYDYDRRGPSNSGKNTTEFIPCSIPTLEYISLEDTASFTSKMFAQFPALKGFKLISPENNKFDNRYIPLNSSLTRMILKDCLYANVPGAVNIFSNLIELDLRDNEIKSITDYDIASLTKLESLILEDNPLVRISMNAFANNPNLHVLNLQGTDLAAVPVAITTLPSLQILNVDDTLMDCTCNTMSNLTAWNIQGITVVGVCDQSKTMISTYIKNSVPKCP